MIIGAGVAVLVCPQRAEDRRTARVHAERQGGVSSIRYFRTVYYMLKVSLAILIDRIRFQEHHTDAD